MFIIKHYFFFCGATAQRGPGPPHCWGVYTTHSDTTHSVGLLDEGSAYCRVLYLSTQNIQNRQTSIFPAGFEPGFPISEWPHTVAFFGGGGSLMYSVCTSFVLVSLSYLSWILPFSVLTTHNTNIYAPVGFKPTIPAGERSQIYGLNRAATVIGQQWLLECQNQGISHLTQCERWNALRALFEKSLP